MARRFAGWAAILSSWQARREEGQRCWLRRVAEAGRDTANAANSGRLLPHGKESSPPCFTRGHCGGSSGLLGGFFTAGRTASSDCAHRAPGVGEDRARLGVALGWGALQRSRAARRRLAGRGERRGRTGQVE